MERNPPLTLLNLIEHHSHQGNSTLGLRLRQAHFSMFLNLKFRTQRSGHRRI